MKWCVGIQADCDRVLSQDEDEATAR